MNEALSNFISEVQESVNELICTTGSPDQAFTQFVLDSMCDKANLGEAEACYAIIRQESTSSILGEINGYAISLSGETVSLFHTLYEVGEQEYQVPAEEYHSAISKLQGYYLAAIKGRCLAMEPSSPDYKLCKYLYENADEITNVRLFVLSNGSIKGNLKEPKTRISDKLVSFDTWDMGRLFKNLSDGSDHLSVDINLYDDPDYMYKIPFIEMSSPVEKYLTYVAMVPGEFLYKLYENHNTDLLQSNVRFFKGKKGCNKGIFDTLKSKPHRFLAYNNGLTATAKDVLADYNEDERTGVLRYIENFQILNGGQTTASIYYAKKENPEIDLSLVYVQMKLIVLQEKAEEIHPLITLYSNTQTNIKPSDLSTNNAFNQKLQDLSRTITAPDVMHNAIVRHWYYERVSGQYDQDLLRLKSKTEREQFKAENPTAYKFDKTELGKIYMAWYQQPDEAINGPQKCYTKFIEARKDSIPDSLFFEDFVAMLIIYRYMEKKNPVFLEYRQVKAQMTLYTLAMLNYLTNQNISLYKIWENQGLSEPLKNFINELSKQLFQKLSADKVETITFRDFCKSAETWKNAKKYSFSLDFDSIAADMKTQGEDNARKQTQQGNADKERKAIEKLGAAFWDGLSKSNDLTIFSEPDFMVMMEIANSIIKNKQLTNVLVFQGGKIYEKFEANNLSKEDIEARSTIQTRRKDKDSSSLYKRIMALEENDWSRIKLVVGRVCDEADAKIVKKIASQKDRSKLSFKQLTVVCRALDQINERFKDQMTKTF